MPRHVASGTFRIDRAAALRKLAAFQLRDPALFLLCWVRFAVARGSTHIQVCRDRDSVSFGIDGAILEPAELKHPFDSLFQGNDGSPDAALRHLALGLLAGLALHPECIVVTSGRKNKGWRIKLSAIDDETVREVAQPLQGTAIDFIGGSKGQASSLTKALSCIDTECAASPIPIDLLGRTVRRLDDWPAGDWHGFSKGSARGWLRAPSHRTTTSRLAFSSLGVRNTTLTLVPELAVIEGMVAHEGINFDLSLSKPVRDDRFEEALAAVRVGTGELLTRACGYAGAGMKFLAGRLNDSFTVRHWRAAICPWPRNEPMPAWLKSKSWLARLKEQWNSGPNTPIPVPSDLIRDLGATVFWLREACLRLPAAKSGTPGAEALWSAPIFLTGKLRPVSLSDIERRRVLTGRVFLSPRLPGGFRLPLSRICLGMQGLTHFLQTEAADSLDDDRY